MQILKREKLLHFISYILWCHRISVIFLTYSKNNSGNCFMKNSIHFKTLFIMRNNTFFFVVFSLIFKWCLTLNFSLINCSYFTVCNRNSNLYKVNITICKYCNHHVFVESFIFRIIIIFSILF